MELVAQVENGGFLAKLTQGEAAKLVGKANPVLGDTKDLAPFIAKVNWIENNVTKLNDYADTLESYAGNLRNAATALNP